MKPIFMIACVQIVLLILAFPVVWIKGKQWLVGTGLVKDVYQNPNDVVETKIAKLRFEKNRYLVTEDKKQLWQEVKEEMQKQKEQIIQAKFPVRPKQK